MQTNTYQLEQWEKVIRSGIKRMQNQEKTVFVSGQQEKTTGICIKNHENSTPDYWGKIVWSDESNFEVKLTASIS